MLKIKKIINFGDDKNFEKNNDTFSDYRLTNMMIVSFWGEVFTSFPIQYEIVIAVQYFHIVIAMGAKCDNKMK